MERGFTLIELLLVIAIVAILATVVILSLNPIELLRQARDSTRIAEIKSLDKAINLAQTLSPDLNLGVSNIVYTSLPDTSPTCATYTTTTPVLPTLPAGWRYACVTFDNLRRIDGSGWVPINFQALPVVPLSELPVDIVDDANQGLYYTYIAGSWKIGAYMESESFSSGKGKDVESREGGRNDFVFEAGSNLSLGPVGDIRVPTSSSCIGDTAALVMGEYYSKWAIAGSGRVSVTKLWYWQKDFSGSDNLLQPGESLELAIYKPIGGNNYSKMASTTIYGTGVTGWMSGDLPKQIEIPLGQTYVFGVRPLVGSSSIPRDYGSDCPQYLPNTLSYYVNYGYFIDPVNVADLSGGFHAGVFGITYLVD